MADNSCSGSTPLKGLLRQQDHAAQHDRIARSAPPHESFRQTLNSNPSQRAFTDFVGDNPSVLAPGPGLVHSGYSSLSQYKNPLSIPRPHPVVAQPLPAQTREGWAKEFSEQAKNLPFNRLSTGIDEFRSASAMGTSTFPHQPSRMTTMRQPPPYAQMNMDGAMMEVSTSKSGDGAEINDWMRVHMPQREGFEDVDEALLQLSHELEGFAVQESTANLPATHEVDGVRPSGPEVLPKSGIAPDSIAEAPVGAETGIPGSSSVSDVAKKILETVGHEDGDKWKESAFLALMRDFRDGKKDIVENDIQEIRIRNS